MSPLPTCTDRGLHEKNGKLLCLLIEYAIVGLTFDEHPEEVRDREVVVECDEDDAANFACLAVLLQRQLSLL